MVAGIAQVGVGFARLALSPHTESQATAVTALLRKTEHQYLRACLPACLPTVCTPVTHSGSMGIAWGRLWGELTSSSSSVCLYALPGWKVAYIPSLEKVRTNVNSL